MGGYKGKHDKNRTAKGRQGQRKEFKATVTKVLGGKREFEQFVRTVCNGVEILSVDVDRYGNGIIKVSNEAQLKKISENLSGKLYKEEELKVTIAGEAQKKNATDAKKQTDELILLVKDRFDAQNNLLDLRNLSSSVSSIQINSANAMKPLFNAIKSVCPGVLGLNLSGNEISRLEPFRELLKVCPALENLSVANNNIKRVEQFRELRGLPIRNIRIEENPVSKEKDILQLIRELTMIFPSLESLNGAAFGTFSNFGVSFEKLEVPATNFYNPIDKAHLGEFVKFIYDCDQDPNKLLDACEDTSQFSMTFDTNAIQQFVSSFPRTELKNRNLLRVTSDSTEARLKMLFMGKGDIFKRRSELPKFTMDASTLKVDTFVMNPIKNAYPFVTVWIFLYGEMKLEQETKTKSIASSTFGFSRTIQLKATPENQKTPYLIANDMIHLYKGIPQSMITKLTPENQAMLTEYVQHYHLDVTTALQNLREVHWNPQGAAYLAENANVCTQNALIVFFFAQNQNRAN